MDDLQKRAATLVVGAIVFVVGLFFLASSDWRMERTRILDCANSLLSTQEAAIDPRALCTDFIRIYTLDVSSEGRIGRRRSFSARDYVVRSLLDVEVLRGFRSDSEIARSCLGDALYREGSAFGVEPTMRFRISKRILFTSNSDDGRCIVDGWLPIDAVRELRTPPLPFRP